MGAAEKLDIVGKDWLTVEEAAHYCGVSRSQFDSNIADYGIEPRNFMGKKLYEKAALYSAIYGSRQWSRSQSSDGTAPRTSTGGKAASEAVSPFVASAHARLRAYEQGKKRN
ncbi:hypothetical protein D3C75_761750 [compost metagenome]|uniref:hypothetical protein n=1 Tax=Stenotrophomonas sp. PA-6-5C TaxID=2665487 RepID=UPI000FA7B97F|nr:hypothetical protein [Stenotrophomonas sp. PA-6-5C]